MLLRYLNRIQQEEDMLDDKPKDDTKKKSEFKGFAEGEQRSSNMYEQTLYRVLDNYIKPTTLKRIKQGQVLEVRI